jgi:hypothetical protein
VWGWGEGELGKGGIGFRSISSTFSLDLKTLTPSLFRSR